MKTQWDEAEDLLAQGDTVGALRNFLRIEEQGICLLEQRVYPQSIRRLIAADIVRDIQDEFLIVCRDGSFVVDISDQEEKKLLRPLDMPPRFSDVCVLPRETASNEFRLLLRENNPSRVYLQVFHIQDVTRNPRLVYNRTVKSPPETEVICAHDNKVLVATQDGEIRQYNAITLQHQPPPQENPLRLARLIGIPKTDYIVGVGRESGLCRYTLSPSGINPRTFALAHRFIGASVGDLQDVGGSDIVVVTQGGAVQVFDLETLKPVFAATIPDEALSVCCLPMEKEGRPWVLIGAAANRIYGLAVNHKEELTLARIWEMPHRVTHLVPIHRVSPWQGEQALAVGLETDMLAIYAFPTHRAIRTALNGCLRKLHQEKAAWTTDILTDGDPLLLVYALSLPSADLDCEHLREFLRKSGPRTASLHQLLSLLKTILERHRDRCGSEIGEAVVNLLERISRESSSAALCDLAYETLAEIAHEPGLLTQRAQDLLLEAQHRRDHIMVFRPRLHEQLLKIALNPDKTAELQHLVEVLTAHRMDLLESAPTSGRVTRIVVVADGQQLRYRCAEDEFGVLNPNLVSIDQPLEKCISFKSFPTETETTNHLLFQEDKVLLLDHNFNEVRHFPITSRPRTTLLASQGGQWIWMAGTNDRIIYGDLQQQWGEILVQRPVTALISSASGSNSRIYGISVTGDIYHLPELGQHRVNQASSVCYIHSFDKQTINVLGAVTGRPGEVLIIGFRELVLLSGLPGRPHALIQAIPASPVCAMRMPDPLRYGAEWLVSTRDRGLQFLDKDLNVQWTTYLDDVATALCCTSQDHGENRLYVGCAKGNILSLALLDEKDIQEVQKTSEQSGQWSSQWSALTCAGQLALIRLATEAGSQAIGATRIHEKLDPRIRAIIPLEGLLNGLQLLRERKIIQAEGDALYRFCSEAMRHWVAIRHPDPFAVIREQAQAIVSGWSLSDLSVISEIATAQWISETFSIDLGIWQRAVQISTAYRAIGDATSADRVQRFNEYADALTNLIGARIVSQAKGQDPSPYHCTLAIPEVAFQGFDNIRLICPFGLGAQDIAKAIMSLLRRLKNQPRIVLIVIPKKTGNCRKGLNIHVEIGIFDEQEIKALALERNPQRSFLDTLIRQIDIASLSPFQTAGPVRATFYGRMTELHGIRHSVSHPGAKGIAVIGPRRIGKTSLLIRAKEEIDQDPAMIGIFLDASPYKNNPNDLLRAILNKIGLSRAFADIADFVAALRHRLQGSAKRLVLFIDEVDDLLTVDASRDAPLLRILRALSNELEVKVVLAGFRILYDQMKNLNSPLFNMLEPMELSRMESSAAFSLIVNSLRHIYAIDGGLIRQLLEKTGCFPNFIQAACSHLIEHKGAQGDHVIRQGDVDKTVYSRQLYDYMVQVYMTNLDETTRAILYLLVSQYDTNRGAFILEDKRLERTIKKGSVPYPDSAFTFSRQFTPHDLHRILELHGVKLGPHDLEWVIRSLVLTSIITPVPETKYYAFVLPDLPLIMRRHVEVDETAVNFAEHFSMLSFSK